MQTISLLEQRRGDNPVVGGRLAEDRDVGPMGADPVEHALPVADVERQLDSRMLV